MFCEKKIVSPILHTAIQWSRVLKIAGRKVSIF